MRRPTLPDYLLLLTLAAIWGSAFAFIKVAVESLPPLSVAAGRITLAAVVLSIIAWLRGLGKRPRLSLAAAPWGVFLAMGVLGNSLPFFLIGWGEVRIDSALAAILMAVMPLSTLLLAHLFTADEPLTARKLAGIVVGFAGLVVLVGPGVLAGLGGDVIRQLAVTGGAFCYALAAVIARRASGLPPDLVAAGVMVAATLVIAPLSLALDRPWTLDPSAQSVVAVVVLGLIATALATLIYFRIIRACGAVFLSFINYLIPMFGVLFGVVFMSETFTAQAFAGLALILAGIAVATFRRPARRRATG
jgi:drug/metabolite transporter (DMT)-like permease